MIPDSEISKCSEFEVKLKIKILKNHKFIEEYSVRIYKIDPYFYKHIKKNKLIKMSVSIYCLELIFTLVNAL